LHGTISVSIFVSLLKHLTMTQATQAPVTFQLDPKDLDRRIEILREEIKQKQRLLKREEMIRANLEKLGQGGFDLLLQTLTAEPVYEQPTQSKSIGETVYVKGISDFVIDYLRKNERPPTSEIIGAYADHTHSTPEAVRNNVQNTLSRLKSAGRIKNKELPGGRRAGSNWFLLGRSRSN
jgi:hypothetical protein